MGSAIGGFLAAKGCDVVTNIEGRSAESQNRALATGMKVAAIGDFASADFILSIVPPAQAGNVVDRLTPIFSQVGAPLFVECNALSPETKCELSARVEAANGRMVDGAIIGHPPRAGDSGPRIYVSGPSARDALELARFGLDLRVVDGPIGAVAALKMCYAGLNKGITALTTAVLLASERSGLRDILLGEFAISQKFLLERSRSSVPAMYPKAYRWVAEFEEIACFTSDDPASSDIFAAIARFYEDRSRANMAGYELEVIISALDGAMA
jgi:3-hydroxyisobutyrate dehydrogenase-like beta-hydroxyacid dehydrogenase